MNGSMKHGLKWGGIGPKSEPGLGREQLEWIGTTETDRNWVWDFLGGHSVPPKGNSGMFRPVLAVTECN